MKISNDRSVYSGVRGSFISRVEGISTGIDVIMDNNNCIKEKHRENLMIYIKFE